MVGMSVVGGACGSQKRHRLGRALFDRAMAWLRERSMFPVSVWVFEESPCARRFYEAMGGQLAGRSDITFGGHTAIEVSYTWR